MERVRDWTSRRLASADGRHQTRPRLVGSHTEIHALAEKGLNRFLQAYGSIHGGAGTGGIGTQADQVGIAFVIGQVLSGLACQTELIFRTKISSQTADALKDIDGGIVVLLSKRAVQHDVPIKIPRTVSATGSFMSSPSTSTVKKAVMAPF